MRRTSLILALTVLLFGTAWSSESAQGVRSSRKTEDTSALHGTNLLTPPPPPTFAGISHTFWSRRDGAPGTITALAQTKDGYLWVGSRLGLYRFDGLRFSSYPFGPKDRALPSLEVSSLSADRDGGIWIALRNTAVVHLKIDGSSVQYGVKDGLVADMLEEIIARPDGEVYTFGGSKLFRLQGDRWVNFGKEHGLLAGGVFSTFFDRDENIWIGRDKKLCVLKKGATQFTEVDTSVHYVSSMAQTRSGEIWIGDAWRSVRSLKESSPQGQLELDGKALILLDSKDNLWVAQDDEGLARIQHISGGAPLIIEKGGPEDISGLRTHAIIEDREGNVWVGTDRGLDRYEETPFVHFAATQLRGFPSLVAGDDGSMWINSHGSPLMHVLNGITTPVGMHVNTGPLVKRKGGDVCFVDATTNELQCYGQHGAIHVPIDLQVNRDPPINMVEDTDGSLLVSFQTQQIWRYFGGNWSRVKDPGLPVDDTWGMLSDSQGRLWLGYLDNRIVVREHGIYRTLKVNGSSWSNTLTFYEAAGRIWAAGSNGLCFFDGQEMRQVHAFESNILRGTSGIVEDKSGNLWLNAGAGVLRLSADEIERLVGDPNRLVKVQVFDENDGLIAQPTQGKRTPSAVADSQGTLWFAMGGDVLSLDPSLVGRTAVLPNLLIEDVLVDGVPVMKSTGVRGVVLETDASHLHNLEISYIGINLSAPERVYYRYRLVGEDTDWQDVGSRRQAFYTRLRPGHYEFQVSASNGEGWSDLAVPLRIHVTPSFYQTWWFMAFCLLSALGLLWVALRIRVRYATDLVYDRLSARSAEREQIARELHDTLLQGFQGLIIRFHLATQLIPANQRARAEMEEALDRADLLMVESRDQIRGLRGDSTRATSLSESLIVLGDQLGAQALHSFRVTTEGIPRDLNTIGYEEIYEITKEALANAFRHSHAANVSAELRFDQNMLTVRIVDDGRGFDAALLQKRGQTDHWGIKGMRERADNLKGDLRITSSLSRGTEVSLQVPARIAYCSAQRAHPFSTLFRRRFLLHRHGRISEDSARPSKGVS